MDSQNQEKKAAPSSKTQEDTAAQSATPAANYSSVYLKGLAMMGYTTGMIFGPMILIVVPGWWLSQATGHKWIMFVSVFIALVLSQFLIFRHTGKVLTKIQK